ncbi:MAG TPA: GNAT family N-acetyltransferase [Acidimicrobiales bacterium]|nr:GNAT family N-acetyltransferase [Acidimicrobiales bacterium]
MSSPVDPARLASLPILEGATITELAPAARRMWWREAQAGEVLLREGEPGDTFGLLVEGAVAVTRRSTRPGAGAEPHHLADANPGSILGELSVLRGGLRVATLTATAPSLLAVGDRAALDLLMSVPAVRDRLGRLASARLARDLRPVPATLKDGTPVWIRPLLPQDRAVFRSVVAHFSQDSLRRRFFSVGTPSEATIEYLTDIDYIDHFAWVVLDATEPHEGLASARFVRTNTHDLAEVAFGTAESHHGRGLATLLLGAIGVAAVEAGVSRLVAHVLDDNVPMRAVFAKAGATTVFEEPGVLRVTMASEAAASVLPNATRDLLAAAVHDIVTAASLALAQPV